MTLSQTLKFASTPLFATALLVSSLTAPAWAGKHKKSDDVHEKVGQMIMVGFRGTSPDDPGVKAIAGQLASGTIGGVILMAYNITSPEQLKKLTGYLRAAARNSGKLPPFIAVDQEGGMVQRLKFNAFPSAKKVATGSAQKAYAIYTSLACQLRQSGINVNFGPVVDVAIPGKDNPVISAKERSYGNNPAKIARFAGEFIAAHKTFGVLTAAKHFPGHGSSDTDSHKGFTPVPDWNRGGDELAPYRILLDAQDEKALDMVMVGHLFNKKWQAPASLSATAIKGMLRKNLGFDGVIITDDMEMGAIRKNYGWQAALLQAVKAGNDIVLYVNTAQHDQNLGNRINKTITGHLCKNPQNQRNCISPQTIQKAFARIKRAKKDQHRLAAFARQRSCL